MSKKWKEELAFFLNERNRVSYNDLCRKCRHDCKQSFRAGLAECPRYLSKRAKQPQASSGQKSGSDYFDHDQKSEKS